MRYEIRISGFGGQGVILSGIILGKAASIYEDKYATLVQSFGPEARGSYSSAQLIISDNPIDYPYLTSPDVVVTLSKDAYLHFHKEVKEGGILVYDSDLVPKDVVVDGPYKMYPIPATRLAETELGKRIVMNMIVVGFVTGITGIISRSSVCDAIKNSVPPSTVPLNLKAFELGFNKAKELIY